MPDNDPLDNCITVSHGKCSIVIYIAFYAYNIGTHVAGIIAANTTGITEQGFVSALPFIGIAPQVTLGACKSIDFNYKLSIQIICFFY